MSQSDLAQEFEDVSTQIDELWDDQEASQFKLALSRFVALAEAGSVDAAESIAEIMALPGPNHDAASAYKWYFIALSNQGYLTEFHDINNSAPYYCGPDGDFRNESMVSELVVELGFDRVHQLDIEVASWFAGRRT